MNLHEFAGLKIGDEIVNHMRNDAIGTVTKVMSYGIMLCWPPSTMEWQFTNMSTAWMHWSKKADETEPDKTADTSAQAAAGASEGTAQG
jgi:hypothetical protein